MTGFGAGEAAVVGADGAALGAISVEVRTANHRFLDLRVRAPRELGELVPVVEQLARESIPRGRVDVTLDAELPCAHRASIDRERARAAWRELVDLRDELAPGADVPFSMLASVPDLFSPSAGIDANALKQALVQAWTAAFHKLGAMRAAEGEALAADLRGRLAHIEALVARVATRAPQIVDAHRKRLRDRAERLRGALDVPVDEARLEVEIAVFAEKCDVTEELTRLRSHGAQLAKILGEDGAVGRRVEFLLQEMQREANTTAAKSSDADASHAVVDIKAEIERMREQIQNVE